MAEDTVVTESDEAEVEIEDQDSGQIEIDDDTARLLDLSESKDGSATDQATEEQQGDNVDSEQSGGEVESPFAPELIDEAKSYFGEDFDPESFGSADNLRVAMARFDREMAEIGKQRLGLGQQSDQRNVQELQAPPTEQQVGQQSDQQLPLDFEKFKLDLDPEEHDENTIKAISGLNDHYDSQLRKRDELIQKVVGAMGELHQQFNQVTGQTQAEAARSFEQDIDSFIESLGEEYQDVFGKGPSRHFAQDSPHLQKRVELAMEMLGLEDAYAVRGRPKLARSQMLHRALSAMLPDKIKQSARKEVANGVAKRRSQMISRPTGKNKKPKTGREAAIAFVNQMTRDRGIDDDEL